MLRVVEKNRVIPQGAKPGMGSRPMKNVVSFRLLEKLGRPEEVLKLRIIMANEELEGMTDKGIVHDIGKGILDENKWWIYEIPSEFNDTEINRYHLGTITLQVDWQFSFKPSISHSRRHWLEVPELPASRNITAAVRLLQDIRNGRVDPESFRNTSVKRG